MLLGIYTLKNIISNIKPLWVIFTLLVFTGLVKLGLWQSERAQEKQMRLEHIQALSNTQALSLDQTLKQISLSGLDSINDLPVTLSGTFDGDVQFLLDNQVSQGQLGYRVYQILHQESYVILVNLGWVLGSINRDILPDIKSITGHHTFLGHVRIIEKGFQLQEQVFDDVSWPLRVQQIELVKFSHIISQELLPFVVYLDKTESIGYKKNWQPIVMPPEKHQAYAFQWFALAFAWIVLMIVAWIKVAHKK